MSATFWPGFLAMFAKASKTLPGAVPFTVAAAKNCDRRAARCSPWLRTIAAVRLPSDRSVRREFVSYLFGDDSSTDDALPVRLDTRLLYMPAAMPRPKPSPPICPSVRENWASANPVATVVSSFTVMPVFGSFVPRTLVRDTSPPRLAVT